MFPSRWVGSPHVPILLCLAVAVAVGACAAPVNTHPSTSATNPSGGLLISETEIPEPPAFRADSRLLVHEMPSITGGTTRATTLLFVPHGPAPEGGWPVVAWAHGTTTPGLNTCAPSQTPDLDGGLTRDGFVSDYGYQLGEFVNAGYAVVAPDFEGLGPEAEGPLPYFSGPSMARSLISGVRAAREADPALSNRYAVAGHSDGAHGVLAVEAHIAEAPELTFEGTAALAPFISIEEQVEIFANVGRTAADPAAAATGRTNEQFDVALMAVGLMAQSPSFDPGTVMGEDLERLLPQIMEQCSVGAIGLIGGAVNAAAPGTFDGRRADWADQPEMADFLEVNDPGATPGFTLRHPTLITEGTTDVFVSEPLVSDLVTQLRESGTPVDYRVYEGADHFSVIREGNADLLAFLQGTFRQ